MDNLGSDGPGSKPTSKILPTYTSAHKVGFELSNELLPRSILYE